MRPWIWLAAVAALAAAAPSEARRHYVHHYSHSYGGSGGDYYTNVSGHRVHRPMQAQSAPGGATARCRDSSWSFSENHRGTCSHHGGVARWL
ncbi:MAG: hypothetical protein JWR80_2733 [Bradyrhizobium sp.]|nr:hypothetical protein [Bradyrhizobium sp.]